jgi:cold shock CspA family protein
VRQALLTMAAMNAQAAPFMPKEDKVLDSSGIEVETGGMSGVSLWRPQYNGRIRSYSDQKGFGFISCDETMRAFGRDVFIHRLQMQENDCKVGQEVIFEVDVNKMGHPQARRVRPRPQDQMSSWDMSQMGGYDNYSMGQPYPGMGDMYGMDMYGHTGHGYHQARSNSYGNVHSDSMMVGAVDPQGPPESIEEMLRTCSGSSDMWEIIEQWGHKFGKVHVVTALYQLGLCRQYEKRPAEASLTGALVDRLVLFPAHELSADECHKVLWALAILEEVRNHTKAHNFAIELGEEAAKRYQEFTPSQMAGLVSSLSRFVRTAEEDKLVGRVTTNFSDYALGGQNGALPRFAPHELATWTNFLKEAATPQPAPQPQGKGPAPNYFMPQSMPSGKGMPFNYDPRMGKGMPGMPPPMGKAGPGGGPMGKVGKDSFPMPSDPYGKGGFDACGKGPGMPPYLGGKQGMDLGGGKPGYGFDTGGKSGFDQFGGKPGALLPGAVPGTMPSKGGPPGASYGQGGSKGPHGQGGKPTSQGMQGGHFQGGVTPGLQSRSFGGSGGPGGPIAPRSGGGGVPPGPIMS